MVHVRPLEYRQLNSSGIGFEVAALHTGTHALYTVCTQSVQYAVQQRAAFAVKEHKHIDRASQASVCTTDRDTKGFRTKEESMFAYRDPLLLM